MRRTYTLVQVAGPLLADPSAKHWGYDLSRRSGVRSGVMYPILHRMLDAGWLSDGWEKQARSRPSRRYYKLTALGRRELTKIVSLSHQGAR